MKKNLFLALCIFSVLFTQAQKRKKDQRLMEKKFQVTRISLKEKFNLPARDLPSIVIRAFCEGLIVGYYPQKPGVVCSYHEFAAHFAIAKVQPAQSGDSFEDVNCPQAFCYTKNEATIEPFRFYFDIFETKNFSKETSSEDHSIQYIRLNYVVEKHGMEVSMDGPLFLYDDLIKLVGADYSLMNPKNDAAKISLKQFFEKRMFTGFDLKTGDGPEQPKNPNKEKDKWEH
jgi:hypothetical protein